MYQYKGLEDTIAAISTPVGQGGIGIVRLSGAESVPIAEKVFQAKSSVKACDLPSGAVHYGWVVSDGKIIDEALLTIMRAPRSYTKEDVVEISCHGGSVSLRVILNLVCQNGARLAEPGEFTKRAFLNGRIDLVQAEAVLDIIQSKTDIFLRVSNNQLKGELSKELNTIRDKLLAAYVEIEAIVNFPEDEIEAKNRQQLTGNIKEARQSVGKLLASSDEGRVLKDGVKIVICGKPNVGKSSLLNIFLRTPRAIVSAIAGTTRDTIEETAQIQGIPFQLVDTAGILEPRDLIEEEAIKRSRMAIEGADLIILMLDASRELNAQDGDLIKLVKGLNVLAVVNKCDLGSKIDYDWIRNEFKNKKVIKISALKQEGLKELEKAIVESVWHSQESAGNSVLLSNMRHIQALTNARASLEKALELLTRSQGLEFVSEEIKLAVNELDGVTGRNIDEDLLDTIFSQFCIGK